MRIEEDAAQLRSIFPAEIQKLKNKDYSNAIVVFYTNCETAPQSLVDELIESSIDDIRAIKAIATWFIQDIHLVQAEVIPARSCTVFRLIKAAPGRATHFYHLRFA